MEGFKKFQITKEALLLLGALAVSSCSVDVNKEVKGVIDKDPNTEVVFDLLDMGENAVLKPTKGCDGPPSPPPQRINY